MAWLSPRLPAAIRRSLAGRAVPELLDPCRRSTWPRASRTATSRPPPAGRDGGSARPFSSRHSAILRMRSWACLSDAPPPPGVHAVVGDPASMAASDSRYSWTVPRTGTVGLGLGLDRQHRLHLLLGELLQGLRDGVLVHRPPSRRSGPRSSRPPASASSGRWA